MKHGLGPRPARHVVPEQPTSEESDVPDRDGSGPEPFQPPTFDDEHPADSEHYDSDRYEPL